MYYEVDTANLAFTKDIINSYETDHGSNSNSNEKKDRKLKQKKRKTRKGQKSKKSTNTPTTNISGMETMIVGSLNNQAKDMKQNKEVDMEQLYNILLVFIDLQPVYLSFFNYIFEQGECL